LCLFMPNPNVFESSSKKHEELVEFVKRWFEGLEKGVKCTTEYPLSLDVVKGKADIICEIIKGLFTLSKLSLRRFIMLGCRIFFS